MSDRARVWAWGLGLAGPALLAGCRDGGAPLTRSRDARPVVMVAPPPASAKPSPGRAGRPTPTSVADEREPNDAPAAAGAVALGAAIRASLATPADVDHFRITDVGDRAVAVAVEGVAGVDLVLEVVDATGRVRHRGDRGPVGAREVLPNLAGAGAWIVRVREFVRPRKGKAAKDAAPPRTTPSPPYQLTAWAVPDVPGGEREPNEDVGAAAELLIGNAATGYLGWSEDVDVWKLPLETLATRDGVDVGVDAVAGLALSLEVLDAEGRVRVMRRAPRGAALEAPALRLGSDRGAPFAYLRLRADKADGDVPYTIRTLTRPLSDDAEHEPNDQVAEPLPLGVARSAQASTGDVDRFEIAAEAGPRELRVVVDTEAAVSLVVRSGEARLAEGDGRAPLEVVLPAGAEATIEIAAKQPGPYQLRVDVDAAPAADAPVATP